MDVSKAAWGWVLSPAYIEHVSRRRWSLRQLYASAPELAEFFRLRNLVFFHPGRHEASLLAGLAKFDRVIGNVGDPSTLRDADRQAVKAREFSRLSLKFPNVVGGIVDDFSTAVKGGRMPAELMRETFESLKSANASLQMMAVVYTMHLDLDFSAYLPCLDIVNLWVWKSSDLPNLDGYLAKAEKCFPGKPIHLGLYLYDYGETCDTLPMPLVKFQLERAREYLQAGRIEGFHLLGSYLKEELRSEPARWLADKAAGG